MYPVAYDQSPPEDRNRLTILLRFFLCIPHFIWAMFYGLAAGIGVIVAWFAIVLTGSYPAGLHSFVAGWTRFQARLVGYFLIVVDDFPPFDGGEHPEYPIQVPIAPPQESYSRVKAFFRILLAIPVYVIAYVMQLWLYAVAIGLWFAGVLAGKTGFAEAMRTPMAYYTRANAYYYLLTEDWPPFDPGRGELSAAPQPTSLPS